MAVATEPKSGTMTEAEGRSKVSPSTEVKTPAEGKVSPEGEEPRIYTQKQASELVHAARSEDGRQIRDLTAKLAAKEVALADNTAEIETLQAKFDNLAKDDPEKFDVVKELKAARDERRQLKADRASLTERERRVNTFELEVLIETIAGEYEDGDAARLTEAVSVFDNPKEEQIRKLADIIWPKATAESESEKRPKAPKPYSGKSEGGSHTYTPTLEQFKAVTSQEAKAKVDKGEWILPYGIKL